MRPKKWPPPSGLIEVLAWYPDEDDQTAGSWTQVYAHPHYQTKEIDWSTFSPMQLPEHGCGCCGDRSPTPTWWLPVLEIGR